MPIRWRLTIFNALAIGAILVLLGLGLFFLLRESLFSGVQSTVRSRAGAAVQDLEVREVGDGAPPRVRLEEEAAEQFSLDGVFVIVRDRDGRVLYESVDLPAGAEDRDAVWREVLRTGEPASGTADLSREAQDYVYATPVGQEGDPPLVLEAGRSYDAVNEVLETIATALVAGIGCAFLLSIGGAYVLARTALRPDDAVVSAAREMTEGDLGRRLPVPNERDEIGRLATTINGLLARLQAAFARREEVLERQRRFAADASHELRTPLTSIRGHSRMLKGWGLQDPRAARKGVDAIDRESERMRDLVESLLALTRGDEGAPLDVGGHDLSAVAAEAVVAARAAAGGKVSVEYAPPDHRVEATFDRERVRQAASILLDNAVKYTPEGGRVEARVGERGERVFVEVSDTGVGSPEDQLPLVFERFHRVDPARTTWQGPSAGGAGLGLSIARQVAEAHGGEVTVGSKVGEGSTFTLLLPRNTGS